MLKVDLAVLQRKRTVPVAGEIPANDPLWKGSDLRFNAPVKVEATASTTASGEIIVRGRLEARLDQNCRRCLRDVDYPFERELTLVFAPTDELAGEDESGEVRPLPTEGIELDLADALREELILGAPAFVECREDCAGLCPRCGIDRNEEECDCTLEEPDARWAALRTLKED